MISVIVPVYKTEFFLCRCVDSILGQTYKDIEVILIDDGSPDMCPALCDDYAVKDARVKVIHQANSGVAVARNTGLAVAKGEYITFVDSDDYIEPVMYEMMMDIVKKYQCDVVMCDCVKDNGITKIPYTHGIRAGFYNKEQLCKEYYPHLLMMENIEYPATISNCLLLFKRQLVSNIRYLEGVRFSEDLLFGAQLLYSADSFYYMKGINLYHYWMNQDSVTHTFTPDKWIDYQFLYQNTKEYFEKIKDFNFDHQLDLMLLFFIYNTVGDMLKERNLSESEKLKEIYKILENKMVIRLFGKISIGRLKIPLKLKIQTFMYKYKFGIKLLIKKYNLYS